MSLSDEIRNIGKRCESKGICGFPHEMGIKCEDSHSCGICISGALGKLADKVYLIEHERSEDRETDELVREKEYLMDRYDESLSAASYRAERDAALQDVERMRPAYEWVRERGGLEEVKRAMQDSDNRRVELCSALGIGTVTGWSDAVVEMDKRLMPPDYEWPRFEDGELVRFGDMVELNSRVARVCGVFISKHGFVLWGESGEDTGADMRFDYPGGPRVKRPEPDPIGADGLPLKIGDKVFYIDNGEELTVTEYKNPWVRAIAQDETVNGYWPDSLTHTKPEPADSWERLEEDAENLRQTIAEKFGDYIFDGSGNDSVQTRLIDIVRRAKALAEE